MVGWYADLSTADAPHGFDVWARAQSSLRSAWESCDRADFLLWIAARLARDDAERRHVVAAGSFLATKPSPISRWTALLPSRGEVAGVWAASQPRPFMMALLDPSVAFRLALPPSFAIATAALLLVHRSEPVAWTACAVALVVALLIFTPAIAAVRGAYVRRLLQRMDYGTALAAVRSRLAARVARVSQQRRRELTDELREIIERPGWLRLV